MGNDKKSNKKRWFSGWFVRIGLITALLTGVFISPSWNVKGEPNSETEKKEEIYYKGKVTARVNVRIGAGENNEKLTHNDTSVQLKPGKEVIILDEVMVGDRPWYHIRFQIGEDTLEGYSTSSYIEKTEETITPTPMPTPTQTPAPTPSPTPLIEEPTSSTAPKEEEDQKDDTDSIPTTQLIAIVGAAAVLCGCVVMIVSRKKHTKEEKNELTEAVKKLQNVKIATPEKKKASTGKLPEIRPEQKEEKPNRKKTSRVPGVYVKNPSQSMLEELEPELTPQERIEVVSRENEEKKALRKELDELREHDIVYHIYFGKGEVFDNTDIKLIEIRFGNDVRFLNKDSLASKKLIEKWEEGERRWRR